MHSRSYSLMAIPALLLLLSMCNAPYDPPPPQLTAGALNETYEAQSTDARTLTPDIVRRTISPTPTETPTASPTPCCGTPIVTVTPYPTVITTGIPGITEVSEEDVQILARLCATEIRAMRALREDACLSIIATVDKRIRLGKYSDGTIRGTVGWNCHADSQTCHYPASTIWGCEGFKPGACWWDFQDDVRWFEPTVWRYFFGERGRCDNYLNYGSRETDMGDCVIEDNGQREGFYNGE